MTALRAIDAWSFSRFDLWRTCPKQFYEKFITKSIAEATTPAMQRGNDIHKAAADFLMGKLDTLPASLAKFERLMRQFRDMPEKLVEQQWAFTKDWKATGYFAKGNNAAWLRVILDAALLYPDDTADVVDHKTGKKYGSNDDQMELFALATFSYAPWLKEVTTRLWYLDNGSEDIKTFYAADVPALRAKWEKMVAPMFEDTTFAPRPNEKCRFCALAKSNGGECRFG